MNSRRRSRRTAVRKKQQNKKGMPLIAFIVVIFCIVVGIRSINLMQQRNELNEKKAALEEQIKEEEKRTKDLEELEKYMQTKKYMEEVARERLGLVYPDEIIIQPDNK